MVRSHARVPVSYGALPGGGGKGDKDRLTMLPAAVKADLARHLEVAREQHRRDLQHGAGWP